MPDIPYLAYLFLGIAEPLDFGVYYSPRNSKKRHWKFYKISRDMLGLPN